MSRPVRSWIRLVLGAALPLLHVPRVLGGASAAEYHPPDWPQTPTGDFIVGRLALLTVVCLIVLGVVFWIARRTRPGAGKATADGKLDVVTSVPLDGRCSLHLLRVEQACFVVGTDATGLKAIHHLADSFEALIADLPEPAAPQT